MTPPGWWEMMDTYDEPWEVEDDGAE